MPADGRARERSRSPGAAPRRGTQRAPQVGHRAMFEDAVRRTGGHADAGAHPVNIKVEPGRDSPEVLIMPNRLDNLKQEFRYNSSQGKLGDASHTPGGAERDPGSVVITNVHFEVSLFYYLNVTTCSYMCIPTPQTLLPLCFCPVCVSLDHCAGAARLHAKPARALAVFAPKDWYIRKFKNSGSKRNSLKRVSSAGILVLKHPTVS